MPPSEDETPGIYWVKLLNIQFMEKFSITEIKGTAKQFLKKETWGQAKHVLETTQNHSTKICLAEGPHFAFEDTSRKCKAWFYLWEFCITDEGNAIFADSSPLLVSMPVATAFHGTNPVILHFTWVGKAIYLKQKAIYLKHQKKHSPWIYCCLKNIGYDWCYPTSIRIARPSVISKLRSSSWKNSMATYTFGH